MTKAAVTCMALFLALPALAAPALVVTPPPGVNLRWDNCYLDGGAINKTFACDTNAGTERLVMSFVLPADMASVSGQEIRATIVAASPTLPNWWLFKNVGTCRQTSLAYSSALPPGSVNCVDWSGGTEAGGIGAYSVGFNGQPNSARVTIAEAVPVTGLETLFAGQEYFACSLLINHAKTVGTGACTGCDQPVCLVIESLNVTTPVLANNVYIAGGANGPGSEFARWQGALETSHAFSCTVMSGCTHDFSCVPAVTPTRSSTWGAVKSLYR